MSTTHTMDYGLNFSLSNFFSTQAKRKQLQQQYHLATSDWKSSAAPMLSCKPLTSVPQQHFSEVRKPSGEHFFDNTNLFPKIPGGKQVPNLGQYHSNAANNKGNCLDAKLSLSCAPYCDFNMNCHYQNSAVSDRCSAQRPQCKSLLKPSMKTSQTDLSFVGVSSDDTENYKTPCSLVKLVNQLLDEPVSDITVPGCSTQSKSSSDYWSKEDESIGEMAIKLADIALFDENLSKSVVKNLAQPESKGPNICMQVNLITQIKKTSKANPTNENSNPKGNFTRNGNQLYVPSMKNKMKAEDYPQKCPGTILDSRRKRDNPKNTSWSGRRVKPDCTYLRGFEGAAFQKPVYNMKQGSGQINKNSETYRKPKSSAPPKHFGGVRAWMQLQAMEANSDSSLSSNEFPYGCKKSGGRRYAADTFKYNAFFKSNEQADDLFQEMQYAQRSRKSFSSSSKSSNSSSSGGHYKLSECVFCKTNGETAEIYQSHVLKDEQGRTVCKVLQQYVCPLCGATGINAHTVKYCPRNKNPPAVATMTTLKAMRSSTGRKRFGPCSGQMRQVPFRFNRYLLPA